MKIGNEDVKIYLGSAEIEKIYLGTEDVYESGDTPTPPAPVPYSGQYLTIESTSDNNTIYWKKSISNSQGKTISASTDNGSTWTEYTSAYNNGTTIATLNSGDTIIFKGENAQYMAQGKFHSTSTFNAYGNIMSLLYGDNFSGQTTLASGNTFSTLFSSCSGLTSAENLILPATTLANNCYEYMFEGCTSLTTAPELPATTLANQCYQGMFQNCTSLTTAPVLSATTLTNSCYYFMFRGCSGLTTAPTLPATTLTYNCYASMFNGCSSLTTAPTLSATTLESQCYGSMFSDCTNLSTITCYATDISASYCTANWVDGVSTFGSFFVPSGNPASWKCGFNGVPSNWTIEDTNGDTYECTGGGEPSTDVPLNNGFAIKVNGEWYENMTYGISSIDDIESRLGTMGSGDMGVAPSDVEELAIGNRTMNIILDGGSWDNCTGLTLAQHVTETDDIHNFPAMQWVNVMANNLQHQGFSGLFSDMNCCPIYVPGNYFEDYESMWSSESTDDCDGSVADRLVAWEDYFDPNS